MDNKVRIALKKEHDKFVHCDTWDTLSDDWVKLADAFFRRIQHCNYHNFPSLKMWRLLDKEYDLPSYAIYVDKGEVRLTNPKRAAFIGDTQGYVYADVNFRKDIAVQYGAKVEIETSNYGLVAVYGQLDCEIIKNTTKGGKILD